MCRALCHPVHSQVTCQKPRRVRDNARHYGVSTFFNAAVGLPNGEETYIMITRPFGLNMKQGAWLMRTFLIYTSHIHHDQVGPRMKKCSSSKTAKVFFMHLEEMFSSQHSH